MAELAKTIPSWKELGAAAIKSPFDTEITAKMFEALDSYGNENGLEFFQIHHRRVDDSAIAIFKMKG